MNRTENVHTRAQKMENRFVAENKAITKFLGAERGAARGDVFEVSRMLRSSKNVDLLFVQTTHKDAYMADLKVHLFLYCTFSIRK